jgi:hypothetical protein
MFRSFSPKKRLLFRNLICLRIRQARIPRESGRNLQAPDRADLCLSPDLLTQVGRQANTVFDLVLEESPQRHMAVHRVTTMDPLFLLSLPVEVLVLVLVLVIHIHLSRILNMLPLILLHPLRPILTHILLRAMRLLIMECLLHHQCNPLPYTYLLSM